MASEGTSSRIASDRTSDEAVEAYYDETYFRWQSGTSSGAVLEAQKFTPWIRKTDRVLDFGCGGGYLLKVIDCVERRGVEINPHARIAAARIGIETVASLAEVPDAYFDVAISNHALEHTTAPMDVVTEIRAKLKPSGLAIFVVPCERYDTSYNPDDRDQHLYTWSPLNLGNMCRRAGFQVISVARFAHRWPPMLDKFLPIFGVGMSNVACRIYARLRPKLTQVRIVGRKP